ncbi:MAG: DUF309 domain-containing protein [Synechocystis sp.]|jgi:hypothetical protein
MNNQDGLALGIAQFNQQNFYGCHDTLEAVWLQCEPIDKNFYQGILQIAVAHYHLSNHNWQGAVTLLGEGIRRLKTFRPTYQGVNTESLLLDSAALLSQLQGLTIDDLPEWLALDNGHYHYPQINTL